jgi:hypothetical protein
MATVHINAMAVGRRGRCDDRKYEGEKVLVQAMAPQPREAVDMMRRVSDYEGFGLVATDGEIGSCSDFLFDDRDWVVRYVVVRTGGWLTGRKVLVSPASIRACDRESRKFEVALSREQIEHGPPLDEHAPVSREYEIAYHQYLGMPYYWIGGDLWGGFPDPAGMIHPVPTASDAMPEEVLEPKERHLRSCAEIVGYDAHATDGTNGSVADILLDDHNWALPFLVVDTRRWLPGGMVVVPSRRAIKVDWTERRIDTDLTGEALQACPAFDAAELPDAAYRKRLEAHFGGKGEARGED